jgi:hypothetical protein
MKRVIFATLLILMFTSLVSAEIIITEQPDQIYNLGDTLSIPMTIRATNDLSGSLELDLLCSGSSQNFYRNGITLQYGEEIVLAPAPALVLTKEIIGEARGFCKIIPSLTGETPAPSEEFKISSSMTVYIESKQKNFNPGERLILEGNVIKENEKSSNGFISLEIIRGDNSSENINQLSTINNGFFTINTSIPEDLASKLYSIKLIAYEKDINGEETNKGYTDYSISINQVAKNLEVVLENEIVEPNTDLKLKTILHDQTGENIASSSIITIKNTKGKILDQIERQTDEFFEYPIEYNEAPGEWTVVAVSNKMTTEFTFNISEKKSAEVELINKTVFVTNKGNVPYCNETILVKIGNQSLNIDVCIEVDEIGEYLLTAPDGEYEIEIIKEGQSMITQNVLLTGRSIDFKEASSGVLNAIGKPIVWIFIIIVLAFIIFMLFRKGYKKSFVGHISIKKKGSPIRTHQTSSEKFRPLSIKNKSSIKSSNKAEVSLSLKGEKQGASVVCLKIKNLKEIENKKGGGEEIIQKIIELSEQSKSIIYKNQNNIFILFTPSKTKTFKNEETAFSFAKKAQDILNSHNRLFRQKIEFGLSLDYGEIVGKQEPGVFKFMAMGKLITSSKKIASLSNQELFLSEEIKKRFGSDIKTKKHTKDGHVIYSVEGIVDRKKHEKFISNFLSKLEHDKKK